MLSRGEKGETSATSATQFMNFPPLAQLFSACLGRRFFTLGTKLKVASNGERRDNDQAFLYPSNLGEIWERNNFKNETISSLLKHISALIADVFPG